MCWTKRTSRFVEGHDQTEYGHRARRHHIMGMGERMCEGGFSPHFFCLTHKPYIYICITFQHHHHHHHSFHIVHSIAFLISIHKINGVRKALVYGMFMCYLYILVCHKNSPITIIFREIFAWLHIALDMFVPLCRDHVKVLPWHYKYNLLRFF